METPHSTAVKWLDSFSDDELLMLAARRDVPLTSSVVRHRRALIRRLASEISRYSGENLLRKLNHAELRVLGVMLSSLKNRTRNPASTTVPMELKDQVEILESLRLCGLLFPDADWKQVEFPIATLALDYYLSKQPLVSEELVSPALEPHSAACTGRPGSLRRDIAEMLARIARGGWKQTQAQLPTRKDLKTLEASLEIPQAEYQDFLSLVALTLRWVETRDSGMLFATETGLQALNQDPTDCLRELVRGWIQTTRFDEIEAGVMRPHQAAWDLVPTREALLAQIRRFPAGKTVTVDSLHRAAKWSAPYSFPIGDQAAKQAFQRLLRSLYWLDLVKLDSDENPQAVRLTDMARQILDPGSAGDAPPVAEVTQFVLQPNGELFAPPNLAPGVYLHLRRITGERKGAAAGMFPVTAESIRGALDQGLIAADILRFLESYSRTPLPVTMRDVVKTAAKQHGRIRLIPAGYVIITDSPELLHEVAALKAVGSALEQRLSDRIAVLNTPNLEAFKRTLRTKGYSPVDAAEVPVPQPLLGSEAPAKSVTPANSKQPIPATYRFPWEQATFCGALPKWVPPAAGEKASQPDAILEALEQAWESGCKVELRLRAEAAWGTPQRKVQVLAVAGDFVSLSSHGDRYGYGVALSAIEWVQLPK